MAAMRFFSGAIPDDEQQLESAMREALGNCDMLVLSGGTSKGAGDVSHRIIARLGKPGIIAHGVALKPGKPLCLAVCDGKPVVILPGFPTSAMFTFHDMIVPVLRRMAGLPPRSDAKVTAKIPVRIASELGRTEFVMVSLVEGADGLIAYPSGKGSGAITSFAQADGFLRIDALANQISAGTETEVTLFTPHVRVPDLVIVGSHCTGLDLVTAPLARASLLVRSISVGSLGGLAAAQRGECDLAPIHLFDEATETYNAPFLVEGLEMVPGWRRMQGIVFRAGDERFEGLSAQDAVRAALADPACIMVNRNQGAGTRILIDRLLGAARPDGYWNQPHSHNAVAAAVAQNRADWGMTIAPVAHAARLGFIPFAEEHYDFALVTARKQRPAVQAFLAALASEETRKALEQAGFRPAWPIIPLAVERRQPLGLGDIIDGVGVEEGIERLCRPCHGRKPIARGPAIDLSDVFYHQCVAKFLAQARRSTTQSPDATVRRKLRPQAGHSVRRARDAAARRDRAAGTGNRRQRSESNSTSGRFAAVQSSAARMPASGPGKSSTLSAITGRPNDANRAGSPLALRISPSHCGASRAITRSRMVLPAISRIGLSPPPIRRARPPASMTPDVGGFSVITLFAPCVYAARIPRRHNQGSGRR